MRRSSGDHVIAWRSGSQCQEPTPAIFCASLSWASRRLWSVISVERPITASGRPAVSNTGLLWVR